MNPSIRKTITFAVYVFVFAVGLFHLSLGLMGAFVLKNNEPLSSLILLSGLLSTLPAVVVSLFYKKFAGCWLVLVGILMIAAILPDRERLIPLLEKFAIPMILIGAAFIGIAAANKNEQTTHNQENAPDQ